MEGKLLCVTYVGLEASNMGKGTKVEAALMMIQKKWAWAGHITGRSNNR